MPSRSGSPAIAPVLLRQPQRQPGRQQRQHRAGQGAAPTRPPAAARRRARRAASPPAAPAQASRRIEREVQQDAMRRAAGHGAAIGRPARLGHRRRLPIGQRGQAAVERHQPRRLRRPSRSGPRAARRPAGAQRRAPGRVAPARRWRAAMARRVGGLDQQAAAGVPHHRGDLLGEGRGDHRQAGQHGVEQLVRQGQAVVLLAGLEQHQGDVGLGQPRQRLRVRQPAGALDPRRRGRARRRGARMRPRSHR